ncbi:MAG: S-adenosylmethionine tRNA ribosyltransferase [Ignavibacteriae bacterium HGW-Ignavibacteriae-1]|jgi:S-adenosylmethionine:tRNA ribosyltransferase-isomerase|nr:MAG: S-adenosylmethionine tRNA ribosyltransferase [Ignavibacteriae bacterium HGW-Ignavibacteriae-1]
MINVSAIDLEQYNYELPDDKIAYFPAFSRSDSKLLFVDKKSGKIKHHKFTDLAELLPQDALLVRNSTKVISARLHFRKPAGAKVELLLIKPLQPSADPQIAMQALKSCSWECIVGGRAVREGMTLEIDAQLENNFHFTATILKRYENKALVQFNWSDEALTFSHILATYGQVPLPPYIKRETDSNDVERYQTVYAIADGSVAAPTAGLHFTPEINKSLNKKGINICDLILHVGPGTFIPIADDKIANHVMHSEQFSVGIKQLKQIKNALEQKKPIIAVGTTSVRTLESLFWTGNLISEGIKINLAKVRLDQWTAYGQYAISDPAIAITNLIDQAAAQKLDSISGETSLLIIPGYQFKVISGMLTNFHQPKSTLILLVASFLGRDLWKSSYDEALSSDYRFLSYGDSSLLL